jgi:hypothetical protein
MALPVRLEGGLGGAALGSFFFGGGGRSFAKALQEKVNANPSRRTNARLMCPAPDI